MSKIFSNVLCMLLPKCLIVFLILSANCYAEDYSKLVVDRLDGLRLSAHELDITSEGKKVKISGWVSSEEDKQKILQAVDAMQDIREVEDEIDVSSKFIMDDSQAVSTRLEEVKQAASRYMQRARYKGAYSFSYSLDEEGVLIKGSAPSGTEPEALVYAISREVSTPVRQDIFVRPWPADSVLKERVRAELQDKLGYDLKGVIFLVSDGVVTLRGYKPTHEEIDQLAAAVLMIEGVRDLKSEMTYSR